MCTGVEARYAILKDIVYWEGVHSVGRVLTGGAYF